MSDEIETTELELISVTPETQNKTIIPFKKFLEEFPINTVQQVSDFFESTGHGEWKIAPQLNLWCAEAECRGFRHFDGGWSNRYTVGRDEIALDFLIYKCRDCGKGTKTFCLRSIVCDGYGGGLVTKVGELPEIHIEIPSYLPNLLGDEWPYFVKGLKCEKQGFGIAAFSYYRRVVEKQKGRMFAKMAEAAKKLQMAEDVVNVLIAAATEEQFSKAIDNVKDHIPESFKVNGHNPMKILHSVLSDGIHDKSDDDCLAIAHSVRIVLQDMSQRIKDALRNDAEAREALSNLMKRHATK